MSTYLHFNEDITLEILSWLPAAEIVRLRCVSRRWRSLLSDPRFVLRHAARNPRPSASSFFLRDNFYHSEHFALDDPSVSGIPDPVLSFLPTRNDGKPDKTSDLDKPLLRTTFQVQCDLQQVGTVGQGTTKISSSLDNLISRAGPGTIRDRVSVSASCNGLVVFCQATPGFHDFRYYVCNPTTRESVELPLPDGVGSYLSLAFDPSRSSRYDVVAVGRQRIHVYSSRTRSWRLSVDKESLRGFGGFHVLRGVYWNGQLVWVGKECIMSFDAEEDRLKKLPTPAAEPNSYDCSRVLYLGESGGKLQMITSPGNEPLVSTKIEILELGSSSSRWSVLRSLDLVSISDFCTCQNQSRPRNKSDKTLNLDNPQRGLQEVGVESDLPESTHNIDQRTTEISFGSDNPISRAGPAQNYAQLARGCREFSPVHFVEPEGVLLLSVPGEILSYGLEDGVFRKVCDVPTPPSGSFYCPYDWYKFFPLGNTLFSP